MNKNKILTLILSLILVLSLVGCNTNNSTSQEMDNYNDYVPNYSENVKDETTENISNSTEDVTDDSQTIIVEGENKFNLNNIPKYSGEPYVVVNDNEPYFTKEEITTNVFEEYTPLDNLGRCGVAYANICKELMPTEDRESISNVKPSGWINKPYDFVDGKYIYNRCHLIGFQLAGENANELNLITGTRYMNVQGMLPFENMIDDYVDETNNHVLYRVTPIYDGDNLVASGVLMEAYSVEDDGDGILFNIYCYNVQPGCEIDYKTGDNWLSGENNNKDNVSEEKYILNTNSKKFHKEDCNSVESMSEKNKKEYIGSRENLINEGYNPCGFCKP
jgi:DNA-entry nuclease